MAKISEKPSLNNGNPKDQMIYGNPREALDIAKKAYFAGFLDGEGTITIARNRSKRKPCNPYYRIYISICSTDEQVIDDFINWYPEGYKQSLKAHKPKNRDYFRFSITGPRAYRFLKIIEPYLRIKKDQAKLAINFYEERILKYNTGHTWQRTVGPDNKFMAIPQDELEKREKMYWQMRKLNRSLHLGRPRKSNSHPQRLSERAASGRCDSPLRHENVG